ncbi:MAG: hypothetical protein ACFE0I_25460 [Elainellaceae cyanobacterium]
MNYVIAVLSDRIQAEEVYSALEREKFPAERVSLVGDGYESADALSIVDPSIQARKRARWMAYWLVPFGFLGGVAFNLSTQFQLFSWAGTLGNQIIGGILGAIGGAMGSLFVGGGISIGLGDRESPSYREHLKDGKYVIVVNGPPNLTNKANRILRQFDPEAIQGYIDTQRV